MRIQELPHGVELIDLDQRADERGSFTEIFRDSWSTGVTPIQWNAVHSNPGVLRGVHVHLKHADYLLMASGSMALALRDMREASPSAGTAMTVELATEQRRAVAIPPGVAHGFLFSEPSIHVYAVSEYWDLADELGCRFDDPALELDWPITPTLVSRRDLELPSFDDLVETLKPHQARFAEELPTAQSVSA